MSIFLVNSYIYIRLGTGFWCAFNFITRTTTTSVMHGLPSKTLLLQQAESKKGCKDQESIQSSTTPDPGYQWESNKLTVTHHKREPRGQPFPSR